MALQNEQEAVLVAAEDEEEQLPESEETALALNVDELRFWVKQVCLTCRPSLTICSTLVSV